MALTMDDCIKLKEAGYSEHNIAQVANVPTPTIIGLARYGKQPQNPVEGVNVEELLKAKKPAESVAEEPKIEEKRGPGRPPKSEEK